MVFLDKLYDRGPALFAGILVLLVLSHILFALRCYVRVSLKTFGLDDWLMSAGMVLYTTCSILGILGTYSGFGQHVEHLNPTDTSALMYLYLTQTAFLLTSIPIKLSLIASLYRIATGRIYRYILLVLALTTCLSYTGSVLYLTFWCTPVSYRWDTSVPGKCGSTQSIVAVSYAVTAVSITIDWTCVILPGFIVWPLQMTRRTKAAVLALMALGGVASISTIIRIQGLSGYTNVDDYLYGLFDVIFWSVFELGLGSIAMSLSTLRPLFVKFLGSITGSGLGRSGGNSNSGVLSASRNRAGSSGLRAKFKLSKAHGGVYEMSSTAEDGHFRGDAECSANKSGLTTTVGMGKSWFDKMGTSRIEGEVSDTESQERIVGPKQDAEGSANNNIYVMKSVEVTDENGTIKSGKSVSRETS